MILKQLLIARRKVRNAVDRWFLPKTRYPDLVRAASSNILELDLIMVSQIQRSGGTLLSQLLDGHPDIWVFPGELHLAKPKDRWPKLKLFLPPGILFRQLVDHRCIEYAKIGYQKAILSSEKLVFDYDVGLHCEAFCIAMRNLKPITQREVLDIYFSTFFRSWVNHHGANKIPKYFCAFAADFAIPRRTVEGFFADYPKGKIISVLRDPRTWTASALAKSTSRRKFATAERAIKHWRRSTNSIVENKRVRPDNVILVTFDDLISRTTDTIQAVAEFLGVPINESLTNPTFNGEAVQSNSSFAAVKGFVDKNVLSRASGQECSEPDNILYRVASEYCTRPS